MKETEWLERLARRVPAPAGTIGIGDDAAVLPGGELVTIDSYVEDVHFRRAWASWSAIGAKMAQSAISDIAAMGGSPRALFATLSSSAGRECAEGILEGLISSGVPLLGGDTTSGIGGKVAVTIAVLGRADRPVLRSGARPGDGIYISGPVGGSEAGLRTLRGEMSASKCVERFLSPRARLDLSPEWGRSASAMIDISDGLSLDATRLAGASSASILLDLDSLPIPECLRGLSADLVEELALSSGDEYELLAASPVPLPGGTLIGRVEPGAGVRSARGPIDATGYDHDLG